MRVSNWSLAVRRQFALLNVLLTLPLWPQAPAQLQESGASPAIKITVKEGESALNNIRTMRAKEPVVAVTDATDQPVSGAQVSFILPELGASGVFPEGSSLTVTTGPDGVAVGRGLKPNNAVGEFQIRVVASHQGQTARAVITQTNAAPKASSAGFSGKKALIVALVGGAGAAVAVGVSRGGNKSSGQPTNPSTSISAGGSTFGPPR